MFCDAVEQIIPWMFVLDHVHYSRWLPVFLQDLRELPTRQPRVYEEFCKGMFTVQKAGRKFSSIASDQAHDEIISWSKMKVVQLVFFTVQKR